MFEKIMAWLLVIAWFGALHVLIIYEPEKAMLFCRIFGAVCVGIARLVGIV
jgi:hypothetical protein